MVLTSISTISSSSPFLSDSPSTSNSNSNYTLFRNRPFPSFVVGFPKPPFSNATLKLKSSSFSAISTQQEKGSLEQFIQLKKGIDGDTDLLQTSIISYKKKFPWSLLKPLFQVDLVSTYHLADKEYFLALQKKLESYDCVLYEMVATKETLENMRKGIYDDSGFDFDFLRLLAPILRLDLQKDYLDYKSENWQHADLDYETFRLLQIAEEEKLLDSRIAKKKKLLDSRIAEDKKLFDSQIAKDEKLFVSANDTTVGSTEVMLQPSISKDLDPWRSKLLWASYEKLFPMPLVFRLIIGGVFGELGSIISEYPEIEALSMLDFSYVLKLSLAKSMISDLAKDTADVDEKSVMIGERNRVAIKRLRSAMDKGHNKIAILYGGGHMPDLGRRLRKEFDLIPSGLEWITAWSIRKRKVNTDSLPFLKTMAKASGWPLNRYQTLALLIFSSILVLDSCFWVVVFRIAVILVYYSPSEVLLYVGN